MDISAYNHISTPRARARIRTVGHRIRYNMCMRRHSNMIVRIRHSKQTRRARPQPQNTEYLTCRHRDLIMKQWHDSRHLLRCDLPGHGQRQVIDRLRQSYESAGATVDTLGSLVVTATSGKCHFALCTCVGCHVCMPVHGEELYYDHRDHIDDPINVNSYSSTGQSGLPLCTHCCVHFCCDLIEIELVLSRYIIRYRCIS
jgi:hypothetical protein